MAVAAQTAPQDDVALLPARNQLLLVFGVMTASLLQVLDMTICNVAIPHMQNSLGASPDTISWVLTSYIIASAVAMPITGWLADRVSVGVLLTFLGLSGLLIARRSSGAAIGWGFQLQHPGFVAGLAYLFFAMGLSLSGVVELAPG